MQHKKIMWDSSECEYLSKSLEKLNYIGGLSIKLYIKICHICFDTLLLYYMY